MNLTHVGTIKVETERLLLRKFTIEDSHDVYSWAKDPDICKYIPWKPHISLNQSKNVVTKWIDGYQNLNNYNWAIEDKKLHKVIGVMLAPSIYENTARVEVGYVIGREFWGKGYCTEALLAIIHFLFIDVNASRIEAKCDVNNTGSRKVLQKCDMILEGILRKYIFRGDELADSCMYSIVNSDFFNNPQHYYHNALKHIKGSKVDLVCKRMLHAVPEKNYVTNYLYDIRVANGRDSIGKLNFKAGFNTRVYYSGHIGYHIDESFRGKSYSAEACLLFKDIAKQLGFKKLLITNNPSNIASRRICEKIGAKLVRIAKLPENHELYKVGERYTCIYEWQI